jgi:hypothetical protein
MQLRLRAAALAPASQTAVGVPLQVSGSRLSAPGWWKEVLHDRGGVITKVLET